MKSRLLGLLVVLILAGRVVAAENFYEKLTPEQRRAAGIEALTPEQQAALSALADHWATARAEPAITEARQQAAAEAKSAAKAAAKAEVEAEQKARIGLAPKADAAEEVIRSRIVGTFRGWGPGKSIELENGQVWVTDRYTESRYFSPRENTEVELRAATFGTWKLYLQPDGLWVRVKRVK